MGLKLGQNITFRPFLSFCSVSGRDVGRDINSGRDVKSDVATSISGQQLVFLLQLVGAITSSF